MRTVLVISPAIADRIAEALAATGLSKEIATWRVDVAASRSIPQACQPVEGGWRR
ncbi:hypothetical protein [Nocardia lijiangensis]|uniref:hypothetical protein n=1 Tax=Nocardia lijiangensis TaxID=299618 RepID=UPI000A437C02|nr:hypothetical protein [Nocardia lijiangensis]